MRTPHPLPLKKTHPFEAGFQASAVEHIPEVDLAARAAGDERRHVLAVGARAQEQDLIDAKLTVHCANKATNVVREAGALCHC